MPAMQHLISEANQHSEHCVYIILGIGYMQPEQSFSEETSTTPSMTLAVPQNCSTYQSKQKDWRDSSKEIARRSP
jgi:hypothetical protein